MPGLGHAYCNEWARATLVLGATTFAVMVAMADTTAVGTAGGVVAIGGIAFSAIDGARAAARYNRAHRRRDTTLARR